MALKLVLLGWFLFAGFILWWFKNTVVVRDFFSGFFSVWVSIFHAEERFSDADGADKGIVCGVISVILLVIVLFGAFIGSICWAILS